LDKVKLVEQLMMLVNNHKIDELKVDDIVIIKRSHEMPGLDNLPEPKTEEDEDELLMYSAT